MSEKSSLKFSAGNHQYWLDKRRIKGVTTLIKNGLPNHALKYWSARTVAEYVADHPQDVDGLRGMGRAQMVAALKESPWQKRDDAAVKGTEVHALAQQLVNGAEVDVPEHLAGYVQACVDFLDDWKIQPLVVERPVASRAWWYAGTPDLIGALPNGRIPLVDWKTGNNVYGSTALQLMAYARAEFYVDDDWTEQPLPAIDDHLVVHLTSAGYTVHRARSSEDVWQMFLHVATVGRRAKSVDEWLTEITVDEPAAEVTPEVAA